MPRKHDETDNEYRTRVIDPISDSFCAAKWLNATIWLGHGGTASCHHPPAHNIDKEEIKTNPSAIHNTRHKKKMRQMMLEGTRPKECEYCWKIEDMEKDLIEHVTLLVHIVTQHLVAHGSKTLESLADIKILNQMLEVTLLMMLRMPIHLLKTKKILM